MIVTNEVFIKQSSALPHICYRLIFHNHEEIEELYEKKTINFEIMYLVSLLMSF